MGINSNNINGNYAIAEDGTIKRPYSELDTAMLNIIRVGANKDDILAAYKARKKCYQLCKESAKRPDYKEYVETLQLDNFPCELKKADYGWRYVKLLWCLALTIVLSICSFIFGCVWIDYGVIKHWDEYGNYTTEIYWSVMSVGIISIVITIAICFFIKYLFNKLSNISKTIKSIK